MSQQKPCQGEERGSSQGQWAESISGKIWDKFFHPEKNVGSQTCAKVGPSSPSSVGKEVPGEAARELPSASPGPRRPRHTEPGAAAAMPGTAEEEELPRPLAAELEKEPASPVLCQEVPTAETHRLVFATEDPQGGSQALLDLAQHIKLETSSQALPQRQECGQQPEEGKELEQCVAAQEAAAPRERQLVPISAPASSPGCLPHPPASLLPALALHEQLEEAESGSVLAQQVAEEGVLAGELKLFPCKDEEVPELFQGDATRYEGMCQGEAFREQELSHGEASSLREFFDWEECGDQELSLGEGRSYKQVSLGEESLEPWLCQAALISSSAHSYWEECSKHGLSHQDVRRDPEMSDWKEFILQELGQHEDSIGQEVSKGNGKRPSVQSTWEDESATELEQDNGECVTPQSIGVKLLLQEEDEWDDISVIELLEEGRPPLPGDVAGDRLPVLFPAEAWVEPQELEPCPQALLCASSPRVQAQALSQQPDPRKKRPSRFRRALRALRSLFRCPCLAPQPQD